MPDKTTTATTIDYDTWWAYYETLKGTPWEDDDIDLLRFYKNEPASALSIAAAEALKYVHDKAKGWQGPIDPENAVAATLSAAREFHGNEWTPLQVREMADHFAVYHQNFDDPMQDRLDDMYSEMPLEWLGDHGRKELEGEVCKDSEIWIDEENIPGVWVFNKPGRKP